MFFLPIFVANQLNTNFIISIMLFNSFEFLIFLPVTFLLYWFVFKSRYTQNTFIVVASYTFYGWWDYCVGAGQ